MYEILGGTVKAISRQVTCLNLIFDPFRDIYLVCAMADILLSKSVTQKQQQFQ